MGKIKQQKGGFQSKTCNKALKDAIEKYNINQAPVKASSTDIYNIDKLLSPSSPSPIKSEPLESCRTKEECQNICVSHVESIPTINRLQNEIYLLNYALDVMTNIYNEKANFKDATPIITKINYLVKLQYLNKDNAVLKLNTNESLEDTIIKDNINLISKKIDEKVTEIIILSRSHSLIKHKNNTYDVSINKDELGSSYIEAKLNNPIPNLYKHRNYINNNTTKYIHILANSPLLRGHNKRSTLLIDAYKLINYNYDKDIDPVPILNKTNNKETLKYDGQYELEDEAQLNHQNKIGYGDKIRNKLAELNVKYNTNS